MTDLDTFLGATPRRARRQLISLVVLALAVFAIGALFVRFVSGSDNPYYVATIETGDFVPHLSEAGIIHGEDELPIRARLSGELQTLPVTNGEHVKFGQILATIEARGSDETIAARKSALASAEADRQAAQVTANEATSRLARFEKVWRESDHRVPSINEMERARADARRAHESLSAANARVTAARHEVDAEEERARGRVIRAPFEGTVLLRDISQGQGVVQDMPLFTLVRPGTPLRIRVPLASRTAMKLQPGTKAHVRLEANPDLDVSGELTRIEDINGQRLAYFTLTFFSDKVQPGMAARVDVALAPRRDVLLVPDAALEFSPENAEGAGDTRNSIYLLGDDGNPRRVFVTVGGSDGGRTEVFSAQLHAGEEVIIGWREAPETQD